LDDLRFRDQAMAACSEEGVARGLASVAREYARAPYRVGDADRWLTERSREVEDLCVLVGARVVGRHVPENGSVVVAERLTRLLALAAAARRAVAIAVTGPADESAVGAAAARPPRPPLGAEVAGLVARARPRAPRP